MYVNYCVMVVNCFKQALHVHVSVAQEHDNVGIREIKYRVVLTKLNP